MASTGYDCRVRINGLTISYDDLGIGSIPVIFIHGFPFNKISWYPQMEFLKTSHRVIAYDIRGFGKSTAGDESYSIGLFADDLRSFMDALEIDKAVICGLSMGGYILLNAVNRFPGKFEAVVFCDTQCIADSPEAKEKRYKNIALIECGGIVEFTEAFVKNIFCRETFESNKKMVEMVKSIILSTSPKVITATFQALAQRYESCSTLKAIDIPALILCGREDIITPPGQAEFMFENIAKSTMKIINRSGHLSNLEQPVEFNKHLLNFINQIVK